MGALEEEVEYKFSVRAVTMGAGAAAEARARTGPQPGSPAPPAALRLRADPAALHLRWTNAASGKGPLLGYYFEARKKGEIEKYLVVATRPQTTRNVLKLLGKR